MERKNVIVAIKGDKIETWGSFTEFTDAHGLPYHSLKANKFPFEHDGWSIAKVPFRSKAEDSNLFVHGERNTYYRLKVGDGSWLASEGYSKYYSRLEASRKGNLPEGELVYGLEQVIEHAEEYYATQDEYTESRRATKLKIEKVITYTEIVQEIEY